MADLNRQDLRDFSDKKLGKVLLTERRKMFGEQNSHSQNWEHILACFSTFAGLVGKLRKARG
jgi:hypothetical protein